MRLRIPWPRRGAERNNMSSELTSSQQDDKTCLKNRLPSVDSEEEVVETAPDNDGFHSCATGTENNGPPDEEQQAMKDLAAAVVPRDDDVESDVHSHMDGGRIVCDVCLKDSPELCCVTCDPEGVPYHEDCWVTERLHKPRPDQSYQTHQSIPISSLGRLRYLNEPNKQTSIEDLRLHEDDWNCFIKYGIKSGQFRFGDRACPFLRHESDNDLVQYPSFVSFVGRTMNGKSFLIRALQYTENVHKLPTPIPAPGAKLHNHESTSSDIHLYPDSVTACDESPILFLDCEGFGGSDVPRSLRAKLKDSKVVAKRRGLVEVAYPRLVYAFSTCVVFVTSGPLAGADDIKRRLISYASQGASGSRNQGFKPSLFVVFNRFEDGSKPDFDWSIDSSSKAFLADENRAALENFYSNIRVIYIPSMDREAAIALRQIDAFQRVLREEHKNAFSRRRDFRLDFTPQQLTHVLRRALEVFSKNSFPVFDWSVEAAHLQFDYSDPTMPLWDLWLQYVKHHANPNSPQTSYNLVRSNFEKHVMLSLRRHPQPGLHYTHVPPSWSKKINQLCLDYAPCGASSQANLKCEKVQLRHGDHHQSLDVKGPSVVRWKGDYEPCGDAISRTFQETFAAALQESSMETISLDDSSILPKNIRSVVSCLCCLHGPPSTILGCGHAFCFDCIRELTNDAHQLDLIDCPIHQNPQQFSPRLLPIQSGYRILSLDGGGINGLAQLTTLKHIEEKCFGIPSNYLFDLVVGTGIGGQIALALPLTALSITEKFRELMRDAFDRKLLGYNKVVSSLTKKTKYKSSTLESQLKDLFGEARLFSAATSSRVGLPNIAVTTVVQESSEAHLATNYNRRPSVDALPVLLVPNSDDCLPLWAAARCTSAAVPYFKPFEWQGRMLIDGGFKFICPAACAYFEALSIWPRKQCDILLSLGTGSAGNRQPLKAPKKRSRATPATADEMADAEQAWNEFKVGHQNLKDRLFRLNPAFGGAGYAPDKHQKLDEVERQAEEWIATQNSPLTHICHQLIAALFFFRLLKPAEGGMQVGEIVCRLPVGLEARRELIDRMLLKGSKLFVVEFEGCPPETRLIVNAPPALRRLNATDELCLRVEPLNLSATGATKIHIRMQSLGMPQPEDAEKWLPISGSPYPL